MTAKAFTGLTVALFSLLMLGGCETLVRDSVQTGWLEIPPGSTLTLNRSMSIQPGRARVFFVSPKNQRDARQGGAGTSCALEVRRIDPEAVQTIPAVAFRIMRMQNYVAHVANDRPAGSRDAAVRFRLAEHGGGDSGGSQMIRQGYHLWLQSEEAPNVMRMTCLGWLDDPASTRPPTLAEIRAVLGEAATLEVATATPSPESADSGLMRSVWISVQAWQEGHQ